MAADALAPKAQSPYLLRPYHEGDEGRMRAITREALGRLGWPWLLQELYQVPGFAESMALSWLTEYAPPQGFGECLVAADALGVVQAFAIPKSWPLLQTGELGVIAVDPSARGKGLGTRLIQALSKRFEATGFKAYLITYDRGNLPAERLYASCGFTLLGKKSLFTRPLSAKEGVGKRRGNYPARIRRAARGDALLKEPLPLQRYEGSSLGALLKRKHQLDVDVVYALRQEVQEEITSADLLLVAEGRGRLLGFCSARLSSSGPLAEVRRPIAPHVEVAVHLLAAILGTLARQGQVAAYCWIPEGDDLSKQSLIASGFRGGIHQAVMVSRPLGLS